MLKNSLGLMVFFSGALLCPHVFSEALTVSVSAVKSTEGSIYIRVWDSKDTWLKPGSENVRAEKVISASKQSDTGGVSHMFDLPAGDYAIAVFHDLDNDGKLKSDFLGRPHEPIANTARKQGRKGPPKYVDSVITLTQEPKTISLSLRQM